MALTDLLSLADSSQKKIGISEERLHAIIPSLRQYVAFWREYPDLFIDFLQSGGREILRDEEEGEYYIDDSGKKVRITFRLFFYQRVFLRIAIRYKYVYAVYPRKIKMCGK